MQYSCCVCDVSFEEEHVCPVMTKFVCRECVDEVVKASTAKQDKIILTPAAVKAVEDLMSKEEDIPDEAVLRLFVKGGGCSGFSYGLGFDDPDNIAETDHRFVCDTVTVVVDDNSFTYLKGTTVEYEDGLMGKGFSFSNPNATGGCGCGSSFSA